LAKRKRRVQGRGVKEGHNQTVRARKRWSLDKRQEGRIISPVKTPTPTKKKKKKKKTPKMKKKINSWYTALRVTYFGGWGGGVLWERGFLVFGGV